jgi:uncharacterized protein DUF3108
MGNLRNVTLGLVLLLSSPAAFAADLNCKGPSYVEDFRYSWRLKGGLRFIAGLMFPTTGVGNLKTTFPNGSDHTINSELLITAPEGPSGGFFAYESEMDPSGEKTLMTYSGYVWGSKTRNERTIFDYVKQLARIHKETPGKVENKVKKMPSQVLRDVLTAIYYLRQNAAHIKGPITTKIYSEGKEYPVVFRPVAERKTFTVDGKKIRAVAFEIVDAPGGKKWPGAVKVFLSEDSRRIPLRIEMQHSLASVQLDLKSIDSCGFMTAAK